MAIFYTILFTLPGRDPAANPYLCCLMLQHRALILTGILKHTDKYYCICDAASAAALKHVPGLNRLSILVAPAPANLKEGMMMKYILPLAMDLGDESVVYIDLDVIPVKPVLFNLDVDTLYAYPEGVVSDPNYSGGRPLDLPAGCSGGIFAYRSGPRIKAFFKTLLTSLGAEKEEFYTLDQPTFNHALAAHRDLFKYLPCEMVSFNGNSNREDAVFWNMCGDPGDGPFHFRKLLAVFLGLFTRV